MKNAKTVNIIGAGPAGLIAADYLSSNGFAVRLFEGKKALARKFLVAGKGGLNITSDLPEEEFTKKYYENEDRFRKFLSVFARDDLLNWLSEMGFETEVGSGKKILVKNAMAFEIVDRLEQMLLDRNVQILKSHYWKGWKDNQLLFDVDGKLITKESGITLLALGGKSWPKTGSDGNWVDILSAGRIEIETLKPANCGFLCNWPDMIKENIESEPLKNVGICFNTKRIKGEILIDSDGIEGQAIYQFSKSLREEIDQYGKAIIELDLKPDQSYDNLVKKLSAPRGKMSYSNFLRKKLNLKGFRFKLLKSLTLQEIFEDKYKLAETIKSLEIELYGYKPIDEAISSAGGIKFSSLNDNLMLKKLDGVFAAGEMLDWESPTGGLLLQGCFSTGFTAAKGIEKYILGKD